jgi:hypothetical protein
MRRSALSPSPRRRRCSGGPRTLHRRSPSAHPRQSERSERPWPETSPAAAEDGGRTTSTFSCDIAQASRSSRKRRFPCGVPLLVQSDTSETARRPAWLLHGSRTIRGSMWPDLSASGDDRAGYIIDLTSPAAGHLSAAGRFPNVANGQTAREADDGHRSTGRRPPRASSGYCEPRRERVEPAPS